MEDGCSKWKASCHSQEGEKINMNDIFTESSKENKAIKIMKDMQNLEILIKPNNSSDLEMEISQTFQFLLHEYDEQKTPFTEDFASRVLYAYNQALSLGMIHRNVNQDNEKLKKQILFLRGKLSEYRKKYAIQDDDTFQSEVTDD